MLAVQLYYRFFLLDLLTARLEMSTVQLPEEPAQVRITPRDRSFREVKPSHGVELVDIPPKHPTTIFVHNIPKRHIGMSGGQTYSGATGDHQRRLQLMFQFDSEFFSQLASHRGSRMFARFDMSACRQP